MASITKSAINMVNEIKEALIIVRSEQSELKDLPKKCNLYIRRLCNASKVSTTSAVMRCLERCIGQLKGFKIQMLTLLHYGAGINLRNKVVRWEIIESAFKNRIKTGVIINLKHKEPKQFFEDAMATFIRCIRRILKTFHFIKVNTIFCAEFEVLRKDQQIREFKYFNTKNKVIDGETDLNEWFHRHVQENILTQLEEFQGQGSGWALSSTINLAININKYDPLRGSSYIDLPLEIKKKKACINVQNMDEACFAWSVVAALYPTEVNANRVSQYPHYSEVLNLNGINLPVKICDISKFEKQNDISVNVFILKKKNHRLFTAPTRLTKQKRERHVNLLLIQQDYWEEESGGEEAETNNIDQDEHFEIEIRYHYCWIKNLSRLISGQLSKSKCTSFICDRCLHYFRNEENLSKHTEDCEKFNNYKLILPSEDKKWLQFKNYKFKEYVPFIIYADFECLLKPCATDITNNMAIYQEHEAYSCGYYFNCSFEQSLSYFQFYRGSDCQIWFVKELEKILQYVDPFTSNEKPMEPLNEEQKKQFNEATSCHICEKPFSFNEKKFKDHCHFTGRYRGAAHGECNINYKDSCIIPVVFHNLSGYDAHFIIKEIADTFEGRVQLLPINKERYISFTKNVANSTFKFRFIDSFRFLEASLDKLVSYLPKDNLIISRKEHQNLSHAQFDLLTRKGVFPYDYITSLEKLDEIALPSQSDFYSKLNEEYISNEDYEHAQIIWKSFNIKTLGEYSDLYLKTDVLLLADVFENFRKGSLKAYHLDPAHYYTLPGFTWDAMLKHTQVKLELLTDIDMIMFIEKGIRGGISQCSNRYSKANNKYMAEYNEEEESTYLCYFDAVNLYGWAMSQYLPTDGFEWVNDVRGMYWLPEDSSKGYILEVDLEYPQEIHDKHKDLPFCPVHEMPLGSKQKKLMTTLYNKEKYVIHYRNLQQCLSHGLILRKIHRVLQFNQSPWLKSYIDLNTDIRKKAVNEFERNQSKKMNNAVFGKTMENVRKYLDIKLVTKWEGRYGAKALIAKPNFHSRTIFREDLIAIEFNKTEVLFNKPIYIGMCVLDISKFCLYNFHYNFMLPELEKNCKLLYTDTDSLIYETKCNDIYDIIKNNIDKFDTSDYPLNNKYNIPLRNKKVLGLMKDELNGEIMTEFVGLRSKMYSIRVNNEDKVKKAKGVKRNVIKNSINFSDYLECLNQCEKVIRTQQCIRSKNHNVYSIKQQKIALNAYDDKRHLIENTTDTLPWGHYSIR